ncbi:MAG: 50S ribosomal protein L9 [Bradymonadia bacterium]|jgi:large subunit ribosomal protein L9
MNVQVILREDVQHVGHMGDLVSVKPGFARNFLLPRGLAVVASEKQQNRVAHEKRVLESRIAKLRGAAEDQRKKLDAVELTIEKQAGENEKLFGSVTSMEIEALLKEKGFDVTKKQLHIAEVIKALGTYEIAVKLHKDVTATIKLHVKPRRA